jgi:hypothetical protein
MQTSFALVCAALASALGSVPATASQASNLGNDPDAVTIRFLVDAAAADFRAHPPTALAFRKVYFGQFDGKGQTQYEICGEFQVARAGGGKEWLHFVTIKTSGYEQYVGAQASSFCTREGMSWDEDDWSGELTKRYRKK